MNLDTNPRADFVTVDAHLSPVGEVMINLLDPQKRVTVERCGLRNAVRIPFEGHEMAIFKRHHDE